MAAAPLAHGSLHLRRAPWMALFTALFGSLVMGYFIFDTFLPPVQAAPSAPAGFNAEEAKALLQTGNEQERGYALMQLVTARAEGTLTECLASTDPLVVRLAVSGLWECWLNEAGHDAREIMDAGVLAMNDGALEEASTIFRRLMDRFPTWAEAINKQATVLYLQGHPEESIALCKRVVALKPDHFGAWNGLTLCAIQAEDWQTALEAVRQSLRLQPKSPTNLQLLRLIQSRIPQA